MMNFAKTEIKREDSYDGPDPPRLTRESFNNIEEEDNFVEMEDEDDEAEYSSPVCKPEAAVERRPTNYQEQEQLLEMEEPYPVTGTGNRRQKYDFDHSKYMVEYRDSQFKSNAKNSHKVAIVVKIDENLCHEFSYNRTSGCDGTKYYTCLGCRKAKTETYKDVIRTIRIDERYRQILSKGDPFGGHHYQCQPLTWTPDARSYGHVQAQPMHMDLAEYAPSEFVFIDGDGTEGIWDPVSSSMLNLANIPFYGEQRPPSANSIKKENVAGKKTLMAQPVQLLSFFQRQAKKKRLSQSYSPRCHICTLRLPSTEKLIQHLQRHLNRTNSSLRARRFI